MRRVGITLGTRQYDKVDRELWNDLYDLIPEDESDTIMCRSYKKDVISGLNRAIYSAERIKEEWLIEELNGIIYK